MLNPSPQKQSLTLKSLRHLARNYTEEVLIARSPRCTNQEMTMIPLYRELLDFDAKVPRVLFDDLLEQSKALPRAQGSMTKPVSVRIRLELCEV